MSEHLLILDRFAGDIAGKIMLLDDPSEAIICALRGGVGFRLSIARDEMDQPDSSVRFVLTAVPARQADKRDEEIARLTAEVERHRMTEEERRVLGDVADDASYRAMWWAAGTVRGYLARTAPQEATE